MNLWVESSWVSRTQRSGKAAGRRQHLCYLWRMRRNCQVAGREERWKSACPEGQFTSRVGGHPTSWSMIGIFFTAAWQMEPALPLVNSHRKRNSVGMTWLTTDGWESMLCRNTPRLVWYDQKDLKRLVMGQVAGVPQLSPVLLLWGSDRAGEACWLQWTEPCMEVRWAGPVSAPDQPPARLFPLAPPSSSLCKKHHLLGTSKS